MDTRFWGPSGWKLIHLVAAAPTKGRVDAVLKWFQLLEYILPCKYCRASFHDYIRLQPLTAEIVKDTTAFSRWAYDIHNRVNAKLRGQGLLDTPDPEWDSVRKHYADQQKGLCDSTPLLGWDFMISVAYTTPAADYTPVPMPDTPDLSEISRTGLCAAKTDTPETDLATLDAATRNRYNLLTRAERLPYLAQWWRLTPSILPCAAWRRAWTHAIRVAGCPPLQSGRDAVLRWMWRVEAAVCRDLRCAVPHSCVAAMKREAAAFESGCGKAKKGNTCRTRKKSQRRLVRTRRARRGVDVL
jgi:hypothetical protein